MTYNCYCDYDDYDTPEFLNESYRKARKQYYCDNCNGPILPGEKYHYTVGKWDGDIGYYRKCPRCEEMHRYLIGNLPCFCYCYIDNIFEYAVDQLKDAQDRAPEETKGLLFGYYRLCVKRNKFNESRTNSS